jgi:hypothetical protein
MMLFSVFLGALAVAVAWRVYTRLFVSRILVVVNTDGQLEGPDDFPAVLGMESLLQRLSRMRPGITLWTRVDVVVPEDMVDNPRLCEAVRAFNRCMRRARVLPQTTQQALLPFSSGVGGLCQHYSMVVVMGALTNSTAAHLACNITYDGLVLSKDRAFAALDAAHQSMVSQSSGAETFLVGREPLRGLTDRAFAPPRSWCLVEHKRRVLTAFVRDPALFARHFPDFAYAHVEDVLDSWLTILDENESIPEAHCSIRASLAPAIDQFCGCYDDDAAEPPRDASPRRTYEAMQAQSPLCHMEIVDFAFCHMQGRRVRHMFGALERYMGRGFALDDMATAQVAAEIWDTDVRGNFKLSLPTQRGTYVPDASCVVWRVRI